MGQSNSKSTAAVGVHRSKTNSKGISSAVSAISTATWQLPAWKVRPEPKVTSKPVMVAMEGLSKQLKLLDKKLNGKDVQVLLDTGSETSIAKASLVNPNKCTR